LPRGEQIPGETHHVGDRVDAVIIDVKKSGHRVKIILSRAHPEFVRQLFFKEIPEIQDHTIEIKAIAREAGYRTKVAVSSIDSKVDCVGACVGVRGSRIKNIIEALGGERIDIVRHNESLQILIKNALQTAETVEALILDGFLSFDDLGNCIEDEELAEIANVTVGQASEMIEYAETKAEELGEEARTPRSSGGDSEGRGMAKVNPAAEAYK